MTEQEKKIAELEQELERISAQLDQYRDKLRDLRQENKPVQMQALLDQQEKEPGIAIKKNSPLYFENFIGLKLLHLVGIVVLVIGISIGVKYAVDRELISPASRIILAYTAGIVLFILSIRLKKRFQLFSAILFSGAMASLYFTTYAAFVYYQLFPSGLAFGIMVLITIFTAYTAIQYDRQEIAILGLTGAYGIPFLISANSDRTDLFFTYIILINTAVVFLSYKKNWKAMVRLAMLASWVLFIGWAFTRYKTELESQAIIVMSIFYVMFALASMGFAILKKETLGLIEIQLFVLNSLLAYFAALLVFTEATFDIRSITVTGVACIVFSVQALVAWFYFPKEKLVFNYLVAFAVLSLVFFIGMKWDGVLVTMLWLMVAVGLFSTGALTRSGWMRLMAIILTGVTLGKLILVDKNYFTTGQKIISYISIGVILLLLSFFYQKFKQKLFP